MSIIRSFESKDLQAVKDMLLTGYPFEPGKEPEGQVSEELKGSDVWVYDNGSIKGLLSIQPFQDENDALFIKLFTDSNERGKGIGRSLGKRLEEEIEERQAQKMVVAFYVQDQVNRSFYANRGFEVWYGWQDMQYKGSMELPESSLEVRTYEERFFDLWLQGFTDSYRELFIKADIKPEYEDIEGNRNWASHNKHNLFLFFNAGEFIGSCNIDNGFIRAMFVCPSYQKKGYGKQILQYVIMHANKQGKAAIRLMVLDVNTAAKKLYTSMGFEVERAFEISRINIKK